MAITEASVPKVIKTSHDKTKNSHYPTVLDHTRTGISHAFSTRKQNICRTNQE